MTMTLLPPAEHLCQECALEHNPRLPHNKQSLFYGSHFMMVHGRQPTWADALAHCTVEMRDAWTTILRDEHGVDIGEPMGGTPWGPAIERVVQWMAGAIR